jgi:undecaprenyl-diphosphatase
MPDWLSVILLGIIEGLTEFIPVSSTGHLLLAEHWLPRQTDLFNIVIQSGAVLAVIPLFHQRFHQFIFQWREAATRDYLLKIFVAFFITGIGGFILKKNNFKLEERALPIALALIIGGILFLLVEAWLKNKPSKTEITWQIAIAVGIAQLIAAIFPGTSRSGASILFALVLGAGRPLATEFSFLVGIPTMLAAGGYEILKAFMHANSGGAPHENWSMVVLGTIVAAIVSFAAVKWLLRFVQTHTFNGFGWYRIAFGILILLLTFR